ncbi:glucose-6-phosphate isomerase [Epsilonproteobacteria bacterium SCGC AD-308-O04]|nr:glucose-6-phosphate isomerase [Epsilonproteobacteria bacterium SCGC AD-308-O04]
MLSFHSHVPVAGTLEAKNRMQHAFEVLKDEMTSDKVGYYKLPTLSLEHLQTLKEIDTSSFEQIVVIGIGGSTLGTKAIDSILSLNTPDAKEMIFFENSDPLTISRNLSKIDKDKACFFIISKSGGTIETTSIFKTIINHFKLDLDGEDNGRVFAITDHGSPLSRFAKHHKLQEFNIPDNVGGRFSVLSAVGVVPLAMAGYDMNAVLDGAQELIESFFKEEENHLLQKANSFYENRQNQTINVLFSYADSLENFTKWYVQLWGESLGKIDIEGDRVGLTPIGLIGSVDQHSFLQLIIEGPKDKTVTFIKIDDFENELTIPDISLYAIESTNFINNKSFNTLIGAQCDATMQSLVESGVNVDSISLDKISEKNIGALIINFELLTSLVGAMLKVNTYNQPGVELGKQILYKNLENI